ncbi:ABC transporter substrate-binding protein [Microlunatus endophyticus]|uniref:ABC transporter substrate-binding protein n=1 Tax=Microlunatus endophyticus TaxID=1716077 RepID=A0A917W3P9_9ACTN|nr:transporter substrate-binding domain-containing protein [Microlunatus endophyticus]GGL64079.1 ABC transporter substrate-binding protein [Microlunatus endophyticus]
MPTNRQTDLAAALAPTGTLRAAINLGNPVLAQGRTDDPRGVTVDLTREIARRLGIEAAFSCHQAARESFEDLVNYRTDIAFLAIEPARAAQVRFTAPYAIIEAVYATAADSALETADDVDHPGIRIGVKEGSAYDLFLTRSLQHAELVRGEEGSAIFDADRLDVAAGLRTPLTGFAAEHGLRILEPAFQQIRQSVASPIGLPDDAAAYLAGVIEELKSTGFVAEALRRSGRDDAQVAPPSS